MTRPRRLRLTDWPERLASLVEERRHTPFAWGSHDCCSFAADAAVAVTGADPFARWRGAYATDDEADGVVGPDGLAAFVAGFLTEFGAPECRPAFAHRGDWVMASVGNQVLSGVHLGHVVAVPGQERLHFLPVSRISRAWAIGR